MSHNIQLSSNVKSVSEISEYLAVEDGEFVTMYGRGESSMSHSMSNQSQESVMSHHQIEQLQIIPIPGIKSLIYSERYFSYNCS